MHTLGLVHYIGEGNTGPAHMSEPAQRYLESWSRVHADLAEALKRVPDPTREAIEVLKAEVLQLRRMVSEGVIRSMVKDEFWKQYAQVPINVETAVKITNRLADELHDREIRFLMNDATAPKADKAAAA